MKLTRDQRKAIKQQLREEQERNADALLEEDTSEILTRAEAKKVFSEVLNDNYTSNKELKKNNRAKKRAFKKQERQKDKVEINWNITVGDAVTFVKSGEEYFGMVIEQRADGKYRNAREAKYRGWVLVMSSAGKHWMNPSELSIIED